MRKKHLYAFINNKQAVSEQFTSLPALSIVMLGITLFILLVTQTYTASTHRITNLEKYTIGQHIADKLTNPLSPFIRTGTIIDIGIYNSTVTYQYLQQLYQHYLKKNINFTIRLSTHNFTTYFPYTVPVNATTYVAVSKPIGFYLNEAVITPGRLTVILWYKTP